MSALAVTVLRMAAEGQAVAKAQGSPRVIFVPHAVPGDVLEVEITQAKSSFARARLLKVLKAGPERVAPACLLHFNAERPQAEACGGCDWQQLDYSAQLRHKREIVLDCLGRIGKFRDPVVAETIPSPSPWAYRNKVQIPFGPAPQGRRPLAGFYAPGSHRIVDFEACPVQPELSVRLALKVKDLAAAFGWRAYDEKTGTGWLRHLFVRTNAAGEALAALVTRGPEFPKRDEFIAAVRHSFPELVGLHRNIQPLRTSVILGPRWERLWGAGQIEEKIGRFSFLVSPAAFLQVNTPAAEKLYEAALRALVDSGRRFPLVLDLYCGVGTLSLWAAQAAPKVIGVEENRQAVRDAYKNAERNAVKNARFCAGRAEAVLPRLEKEGLPAACAAIVDPPRMGLSSSALRLLTSPRLRRLVYVSCDPATFARDAAFLCRSGFRLSGVQPVDLFPQTSHVELVGLLDRP